MSKWLFAVTRNRKSRFTQKFFKTKSANCPRCRKVVGLLRTFHGDELSKKSTVTHVNFLPRFVNGNLSQSAWPATFVFAMWPASEAARCPANTKVVFIKILKFNLSPGHSANMLCLLHNYFINILTEIIFAPCKDEKTSHQKSCTRFIWTCLFLKTIFIEN